MTSATAAMIASRIVLSPFVAKSKTCVEQGLFTGEALDAPIPGMLRNGCRLGARYGMVALDLVL
jgi:hypothetical protein